MLKMFLQAHQEALYLAKVFHSICFKFLDMLDHLRSHPGAVEDNETTMHPASTGQDHSKRSILFRLGDIFQLYLVIVKPVLIKSRKNLHIYKKTRVCREDKFRTSLLSPILLQLSREMK